jgi:hypothetical protein
VLDSLGRGRATAESASPSFYDVAGRTLSVSVSDERAARAIGVYIGAFHLTPAARSATAEIACSLEFSPGPPPPLPSGLHSFDIPVGVCRTDGQSYYMDVRASRICVEPPPARQVRAWIGGLQPARKFDGPGTVVPCAFQAALRRAGRYELHAAAVAEPASGAGLLLIGESNSGKSTLTLKLAQAGWRYLSDDTLLLSMADDAVEAHAFRRYFSFPDSLLKTMTLPRAEAAMRAAVPLFPDKRPLDPDVVFPGQFRARCTPRALCFPEITGEAESRLLPLAPAQVMARLIEQCPWSCYDRQSSAHHLELLSTLARQADSFVLLAGRDILDEEGRAEALVRACLRERRS